MITHYQSDNRRPVVDCVNRFFLCFDYGDNLEDLEICISVGFIGLMQKQTITAAYT